MKITGVWSIFLIVFCMMISCNDPVAEKYQKILKSHPKILSKALPNYYLNLFQPRVRGKIKLITSLEHVGRDTVCDFLYDQEYYVALYTLSRSYDISLQHSLRETFSESNVEFGIPFYINNLHFIVIRHRIHINDDDSGNSTNIFISFGGAGFSTIEKHDTVADYLFECKNLSIKCKANGPQEIFVGANDYRPLETLFIKKAGNLFLIFITTKKDSSSFPRVIGMSLFT